MRRTPLISILLFHSLAASLALSTSVYAADTVPAPTQATPAAATDAALTTIDAQIAAAKVDKTAANWKTNLPLPTAVVFDAKKKYLARMVTNKGEMVLEFKPQVAPLHVTNFIYLARLGFYDGLPFHRVIQGFMAQGGDPLGNGSGGPGYQFAGEFDANTKHDQAGVVSTANAGPGTDGSQFFIMFAPYPSLDMKYSIFGQVVDGLEVLSKLEAAGNPVGAIEHRQRGDRGSLRLSCRRPRFNAWVSAARFCRSRQRRRA
jgi:peptidyl-prolyl cis-trans isomerase B (cyclophilin B)